MGCLYQIEFPDGKSYIGISQTTASKRLTRHKNRTRNGSSYAVHVALRKFPENFTIKEIAWSADWQVLCRAEQMAIETFKTKVPHGYNMTSGGNGALGYKHTELAKKKMRGKIKPEANRSAVSAANKGNKYAVAANIGNKNAAGKRTSRTKLNIRIGKALGKARREGIPFSPWKPNS